MLSSIDFELVILASYLLSNDDLPLCDPCGLPLTVKHILVACSNCQDIREKYFMVRSVKELFDSVDNHSIIGFITETRFYSKL